MSTKQIYSIIAIVSIVISAVGCKKFIEVDAPYTSLNNNNVYSVDATAIAAVSALYTKLGSADGGIGTNLLSITYYAGLSADELTLFPGSNSQLTGQYRNELTSELAPNHWNQLYQHIYLANAAIEGLSSSKSLTQIVRQHLLGEAKFIRAFCYFYLTNLYGDVPLALTTDYKVNSLMPRASAIHVWEQITKDLLEAKNLLSSDYMGADIITSSVERIRPNKWTATALLSRVYLYRQEYMNAETQASEIINNTLYALSNLNNVFLKDPTVNKEVIWQIQGTSAGWNTNDARVFILPSTGPDGATYPVSLNKMLLSDFEANDDRKTNWIQGIVVGSDSFYYAFKYRSATLNDPVTEYNVVFRLAEQYLIRAEARAMQNKLQQAIDDVNTIRLQHGGLSTPLSAPATQANALNIILHERKVELFCEWGHRWLDLKRTNTTDLVMGGAAPLKGGTWQSTDKLYPISPDELTSNPNLTQTPGY